MTIRLHAEHVQLLSTSSTSELPQHNDFSNNGSCPTVLRVPESSREAYEAKLVTQVHSLSSQPILFARPVTPPVTSSSGSEPAAAADPNPNKSRRRVCFNKDLVSEVWTRPYTKAEDVSDLFYSNDETTTFRQEYRMERKLLAVATEQSETIVQRPLAKRSKRSISMVVVKSNDVVETYRADDSCSTFSFDNNSFWNGAITWF